MTTLLPELQLWAAWTFAVSGSWFVYWFSILSVVFRWCWIGIAAKNWSIHSCEFELNSLLVLIIVEESNLLFLLLFPFLRTNVMCQQDQSQLTKPTTEGSEALNLKGRQTMKARPFRTTKKTTNRKKSEAGETEDLIKIFVWVTCCSSRACH